jgi:hypothetical protein
MAKKECSLYIHRDKEGNPLKGECACGKVFYPSSEKGEAGVKRIEDQYREHYRKRYGPINC